MSVKNSYFTVVIIGAFMLLIVVTNQFSTAAEEGLQTSGKIYVADTGGRTMLRMNMDGSEVETLFQLPERHGPLSPVLDPRHGRMFFIDRAAEYRYIYSADMDGQNRQLLPAPFGHSNTLVLDHAQQQLLWNQSFAIGELDLDSEEARYYLYPGPPDPGSVAVDEANELVYWVDNRDFYGGLYASKMDGSWTMRVFGFSLYSYVTSIALDETANDLYYAVSYGSGYSIVRLNLETMVETGVIPNRSGYAGQLALDLAAGKLYWTASEGTGVIRRANLDGTAEEPVLTGLQNPGALALDLVHERLIWGDWDQQKIQSAPLNGGAVVNLLSTAPQRPAAILLDTKDEFLYWTGGNGPAISRAKLDGSQAMPWIEYEPAASRGLALDAQNGRFYWSDREQEAIMFANVDGTDRDYLVHRRLWFGEGLAYDSLEGKIYWADTSQGTIARADRDGTAFEEIVTSGLALPSSVAVDPLRGKVYWADQNMRQIGRANLDGSESEILLGVADGLQRPNAVTLDVPGGKLYWTDWKDGSVKRANLDGSAIEILLSGLVEPNGTALDQPPPQYRRQYLPVMAADG